jgi:hypothetical protein
LAYQINPKTVLRAGWGIVYAGTTDANGATQGGLTAPAAVDNPSFGEPLVNLRTGIPSSLVRPFPNFDPGQYPTQGLIQSPLVWYDQNAGRPARQMQWSIGLQREVGANFVVEAAYVGNRGAWWYAPGLVDVNALTPERLAAFGLNPTVASDRTILTSQVRNPGAGRFQNVSPYPGFPVTSSVAQSLRPFPQFGNISALWAPLGNTWYDSLQAKATKRLSHGLTFTSVFTWQKSLLSGAPSNPVVPGTGGVAVNDVFNRKLNKALSPFDQPFVFNIAASYTVPKFIDGDGMAMKAASFVTRDWALNVFMAYSSGLPILVPTAQTNLNTLMLRNVGGTQTGYVNRVPGVSPFLQDLNCNCYDPNKEFVLNPAAWSAPAPGTFGNASAYYGDYRFQRRPQENVGIGRIFRIRERMSLNVRAEFTNIFNRSVIPNPTGTAISNAGLGQTRNATTGVPTAGFGFINTGVAPTIPTSRQGTIVARFNF